jgi:hypothetical protein
MSTTLKEINKLVANASPDDYSSISYNKYFKDLALISNSVIAEREELKQRILALPDGEAKLALLELL